MQTTPTFSTSPKLRRYDARPKSTLQAWDAADDLILEHLASLDLAGKRILILGDRFGALSCGLQGLDLTVYTDSFIAAQSIRANSGQALTPISLLTELAGEYDYVLIRIPKNMSFFEDMLCRLSGHLKPTSKIVCGYMVKHQSKSAFDLLNQLVGETHTSLAKKKARLIHATFSREKRESPYPLQVKLDPFFNKPFVNDSNLFSREKLDIGTRFLLENIPSGEFSTILDLGCGNGAVGIRAKQLHPSAKIVFTDESRMAVQSAEANYASHFGDEARFLWTHCYEKPEPESVDLVICNPPFHQETTRDDSTAWQMFADAHRALRIGGTLRVIGNSHLMYQVAMKNRFGNSHTVAVNGKFMIVDSYKRPLEDKTV